MSTQIPTYEEAMTKIAALEKQGQEFKTLLASKKGNDDKDNDDKKLEASFKIAMEEVDKEDKEKSASYSALKAAFKVAEDETDTEKKKEAMKKAMDMKDEQDKKAKKAEDTPKENVDKEKEKEAKIATIVMEKVPLMQKILEATRTIDPTNYDAIEAKLKVASLDEVKAHLATIEPFMAAVGIQATNVPAGQTGMLPFQASAALNSSNPENIFEASVDTIDFSKVKTSDLMGMYN